MAHANQPESASNGSLLVRVPGSTSNLGPGFDTLGLALDLFNEFQVTVLAEGPCRLVGDGTCEGIDEGTENPFFEAYERIGELAGRALPPVAVTVEGRVPVGVGLGSSASARVAGALAANHLLGAPFSTEVMIGPLVEIEGHPDNVAPELFGGLTASARLASGVLTHVYAADPAWRVALLVPDYSSSTRKARKALPKKVYLEDAVFNLSRVPLLIDALVAGDAAEVARLMEDRLHERKRAEKIKRHGRIRAAALEAGATATFISGSGPAIAALCQGPESARAVLGAMLRATEGASFRAGGLLLAPTPLGATVIA